MFEEIVMQNVLRVLKFGDRGKEEEEEVREMIPGEEHWRRWQEKNKLPFVSLYYEQLTKNL